VQERGLIWPMFEQIVLTATRHIEECVMTHRQIKAAATAAIAAAVLYQGLLFALIAIRPDLDPYWHTLSEWAIGPWGWLMQLAFLIAAVSYGLLAVAMHPHVTGMVGRTGELLLLVCAIALVGAGLCVTDPLTTLPDQLTTRGTIHAIGGVVQLALLPIAALLATLNVANGRAVPESTRRTLRWIAGLPLLALLAFVVHLLIYVIPLGDNAYGPNVPLGWPVRGVLFAYMVWLIVLARYLLHPGKETQTWPRLEN
jgi:Protein of unknown function (DUF998)